MTNPIGRPSKYSEDLTNEICTRLAGGESLNSICKSEHLPCISTVLLWVVDGKHKEFSDKYTCARAAQGFTDADRIREIAALVGSGQIEPNAGRVIIDAYKWTAERNAPKNYGSKVDLNHGGQKDNPISVISADMSAADATRAYTEMMRK
jgi:hypothetical protein